MNFTRLIIVALVSLSFQNEISTVDHIFAHSHMDLGWIATFDKYYFGDKSSVQNPAKKIFDHVFKGLCENSARKFIVCEIAFFQRWFNDQTNNIKNKVKSLHSNGQYYFVNGGWGSHDEASPDYNAILTQFRIGLRFLQKEFNVTPSIGWQLDPFGHSAGSAYIYSLMGYRAIFLNRISDEEKKRRVDKKELYFEWQNPPESINKWAIDAFVIADYFCPNRNMDFVFFKTKHNDSERLLTNFNTYEKDQAKKQKTKNLCMFFGCDFKWGNAEIVYSNVDLLIESLKEIESMKEINYSNPELFLDGLDSETSKKTKFHSDFYPYIEKKDWPWTGYFTSIPFLKRLAKQTTQFLFGSYKLLSSHAIGRKISMNASSIYELEESLSLLIHHDAITGTSKTHVSFDYVKRISTAYQNIKKLLEDEIQQKLFDLEEELSNEISDFELCYYFDMDNYFPCNKRIDGMNSGNFLIGVFNPTEAVKEIISIPVNGSFLEVKGLDNSSIISETICENAEYIRDAKCKLYIEADLSPWEIKFLIVTESEVDSLLESSSMLSQNSVQIKNNFQTLSFRKNTNDTWEEGGLFYWTQSRNNNQKENEIALNISYRYYNSYHGGNTTVRCQSGAYIFNPNEPKSFLMNERIKDIVLNDGFLIKQFSILYESYEASFILERTAEIFFEIQTDLKPLSLGSEAGKDITININPFLMDNFPKYYFTDSNDILNMKREVNFNPLNIGGSFYPISSNMFIPPTLVKNDQLQMGVMPDRAQGGRISNYGFEFNIERKTKTDDHKGLSQNLEEVDENEKPLFNSLRHLVVLSINQDPDKFGESITQLKYHNNFARPFLFFNRIITSLQSFTSLLSFNNHIGEEFEVNQPAITFEYNWNKYLETQVIPVNSSCIISIFHHLGKEEFGHDFNIEFTLSEFANAFFQYSTGERPSQIKVEEISITFTSIISKISKDQTVKIAPYKFASYRICFE